MKKILALCLALVMVFALSVPAFAAPGFVSSPSGNKAPILVEYSNSDPACTATLEITSYADRHELDEATRLKMEKAYNSIVNAINLTTLNADLAELANKMNIDPSKLAVSDLFDISYENCGEHEGHGHFNITIKPELLSNFVALLHFNGETWDMVKDAKVVNDHLVFSVTDLSPFAIVVDTTATPPATGDFTDIAFYVAAMMVSVAAFVVVAVKMKKKETN